MYAIACDCFLSINETAETFKLVSGILGKVWIEKVAFNPSLIDWFSDSGNKQKLVISIERSIDELVT